MITLITAIKWLVVVLLCVIGLAFALWPIWLEEDEDAQQALGPGPELCNDCLPGEHCGQCTDKKVEPHRQETNNGSSTSGFELPRSGGAWRKDNG